MRDFAVNPKAETHRHERVRCIGCGLCALACDRAKAVAMNAVPDYQMRYKSWFPYLLLTTPHRLRNAWSVSRQRKMNEPRQGGGEPRH